MLTLHSSEPGEKESEEERKREEGRVLAQSAALAACRGSEQRIAVISVLLFKQESPFLRAAKTARWLLCTQWI